MGTGLEESLGSVFSVFSSFDWDLVVILGVIIGTGAAVSSLAAAAIFTPEMDEVFWGLVVFVIVMLMAITAGFTV